MQYICLIGKVLFLLPQILINLTSEFPMQTRMFCKKSMKETMFDIFLVTEVTFA